MKEQGKNPPDLTNEEEIGSLPEKAFRIMLVKMTQNLENRILGLNRYLQDIPSKNSRMHLLLKCTWNIPRIYHMLGHREVSTNLRR